MKKYWPAVLLVLGICVTLAAGLGYAYRHPCGVDAGKWHFVERRSGDGDANVLTATWSSRDSCAADPSND